MTGILAETAELVRAQGCRLVSIHQRGQRPRYRVYNAARSRWELGHAEHGVTLGDVLMWLAARRIIDDYLVAPAGSTGQHR